MMNRTLCFFVLLLAISSCSEIDRKEIRDDKGNLRASYSLNKEGKIEGKKTFYRKDGTIEKTLLYRNGRFQGEVETFDSLGQIKEWYHVYYSNNDKKWVKDEWKAFNEERKVDTSKSLFVDFKIDDFQCFTAKIFSDDFHKNLDYLELVVNYGSRSDTLFYESDKRYFFQHCIDLTYDGKVVVWFNLMKHKENVDKTTFGFGTQKEITEMLEGNIKFLYINSVKKEFYVGGNIEIPEDSVDFDEKKVTRIEKVNFY